MDEIKANKAYFIKLGRGGEWEKECIEQDHTLRLGFNNPLHSECLAGKWDKIREYWLNRGKKKGKATEITNQIKKFYESDENTLWVTFYKRKMYWCFAKQEVKQLSDGTRIRKAKGKWKSKDMKGKPLTLDNLSGKLTKVQGFQGTICTVKEFEYLIKKLNHRKLPEVEKAEQTLDILLQDIEPLIQNLTWKDFELLIDLIFTQAGWQRISVRGKSQKDLDLNLMSPVTGNRAFVQVKSKANKSDFEKYINIYKNLDEFDEMYFVVHTSDKSLNEWNDTSNIKLWEVTKLSKLVVDSGLIGWLIKKAS